jgi:hypothetical protein
MSKTLALAFGVVAIGALTASAQIIPVFQSVTPSGSNFLWTYTADLGQDVRLENGNFFTIYDFSGLVGGAASVTHSNPNWTVDVANTGMTPPTVIASDDGSIPNVTFVWNGGTLAGPANLGTFAITSSTNVQKLDDFSSRTIKNTGAASGTTVDNIGKDALPTPGTQTAIPLPAAVTMFPLGALVAGFFYRRNRR